MDLAFFVFIIYPMFYVYILYSQSADKFYVGQTSDVHKRLREHNNPLENSKFTAKFIPWEIVLFFHEIESFSGLTPLSIKQEV